MTFSMKRPAAVTRLKLTSAAAPGLPLPVAEYRDHQADRRCAAWRRRSCREEEALQREETAEPKPKQRRETRRETEPSRAQRRCWKLPGSHLTELFGEMEKKDGARQIPSAWSVPTSSPPSSDTADRSAGLDPALLIRPGSVKLHQFGCWLFVVFALDIFVPVWVKKTIKVSYDKSYCIC